jgi:hypothetical protein
MIETQRKQELENLIRSFPEGEESTPYYAFFTGRLKENPASAAEEALYLIELGYHAKNVFFTYRYACLLNPYIDDTTLDPYFKEGKNKKKCVSLLKRIGEDSGYVPALSDLIDIDWNASANYESYLKRASLWLKLYMEKTPSKEADAHILEDAVAARRLGFFEENKKE